MKAMLKKFWNDEAGFVVTVELILVATVLVIGLVTGLAMLRDSVIAELADTAQAFGAIDQSYHVDGTAYGATASATSSQFLDLVDGSDQADAQGTGYVAADTGIAVLAIAEDSGAGLEGN